MQFTIGELMDAVVNSFTAALLESALIPLLIAGGWLLTLYLLVFQWA